MVDYPQLFQEMYDKEPNSVKMIYHTIVTEMLTEYKQLKEENEQLKEEIEKGKQKLLEKFKHNSKL